MRKSIILGLSLCMALGVYAQESTESISWEELKTHKAAPDWFQDAKLGVYFHWGVYSVPAWGSEWYPRWRYTPDRVGWGEDIYDYHNTTYGDTAHYHDFIPLWKAPHFDAKEWVDMFENMGARFIGAIAEHHDGFSLWDSQVNEWNSAQMGPEIDVVKQIGDEVKSRGLKYMTTFHHGFHMMFYPKQENTWTRPVSNYSLVYDSVLVPQEERYRKLYCNMHYEEANDLWLAKLDEVIQAHCPDYIWMDFGQRFVKESHRKAFLKHYFDEAKARNKEVVVNTKGHFFPQELAVVNVERATMPDIQEEVWITDFILGSSWCYNKARRTAINPSKAIRILAEVVSKNGVMLLSAGPMADGTMPAEQVAAMEAIGVWMNRYGEAIYGTRPFIVYGEGPTQIRKRPNDNWNEFGALKGGLDELNAKDVRYTRKGNIVYAIQLGWDEEEPNRLLTALKPTTLKVNQVTVLGIDEKIEWKQTKKGLKVRQPQQQPVAGDAALVYRIVLKD
ncbi:alpha-L-fucosidase [Marinoscillum furvescens]|uniref:alpha-L-fucosidase n=1 Tax=Marinoscillum furvescens DSM 4134 TaxID=1122208 RepID=A0A3D9L1X4_MARFU|nr:alpha-L-fucosidase [Marinoscillum furvescens]RED95995.1 alpha-L-fucosidase [Marinoscillum furvescens DSM 4134]